MQNPSGKQITEGCYKQLDVEGYDVEVCFCNHDRCNTAAGITPLNFLLHLVIALVATAANGC